MVTVYIRRDDLSCWVGKGHNMPVRVLKWSPVPVALAKRLNVEEGARAPCAGHRDSPAAGGSPARREPGPAVCAVCVRAGRRGHRARHFPAVVGTVLQVWSLPLGPAGRGWWGAHPGVGGGQRGSPGVGLAGRFPPEVQECLAGPLGCKAFPPGLRRPQPGCRLVSSCSQGR